MILTAHEQDEAAASAEYGAQFRRDVEDFLTHETLQAVVVPGRRELPPVPGLRYAAFVNPSGGSQDAMALAIAHFEKGRPVLDVVRERRPPFSPEEVVNEFCDLLKAYRARRVRGDRYGGEWPRERFRERGTEYDVCDKTRAELYLDLLPLITSAKVELLEERFVPRGGLPVYGEITTFRPPRHWTRSTRWPVWRPVNGSSRNRP